MKDKIIHDYTQGNISKQLFLFAVPFMASNAFQVVYSLTDMAIVGNFVGKAGLAATANGSQVTNFVTMLSTGFASAGQILIAQYLGARRYEDMSKTIGTLFDLLMGLAVVIMTVGFLLNTYILNWMHVPEASYQMTYAYQMISFAGIPFTFGYNMVSAVLRGMGDSKHPFWFVMIAASLNIVLDLIFVGLFHWGPAGASAATVMGQAFSFLFSVWFLYQRKENFGFDFRPHSFQPEKCTTKVLLKIGLPFALQSASINFSMMFVGSFVNLFGVAASAVFGIGIKVDDMVGKLTQGMSLAASSMAGQNIAAEKHNRVISIVNHAMAFCCVVYGIYAVILLCFHEQIFSIFNADADILSLAPVYIKATIISFPGFIMMRGCNGLIRALGNIKLTLFFAFADAFLFRVGMSYLLGITLNLGLSGFFIGYCCAVYGTGLPALLYFLSGKWKNFKLIKSESSKRN